jgi:hypothetical protein
MKGVNYEIKIKEMNLKTHNYVTENSTNLKKYYKECKSRILTELEKLINSGSGWALNSINYVQLRINKYVPLNGASYIDLPDK